MKISKYFLIIFTTILFFAGSIILTSITQQSLNEYRDKFKCIVLGIILIFLSIYFFLINVKIIIDSIKKTIICKIDCFFIIWIFMSIFSFLIIFITIIWIFYVFKYGIFNWKTKGCYNSGWAWNNFAAAKAFILGNRFYTIVLGKIQFKLFWSIVISITLWSILGLIFEIVENTITKKHQNIKLSKHLVPR